MGFAELAPGLAVAVAELVSGARAIGLDLSDHAVSRFENYIAILLLWRRNLSLISTATPQLIVRQHVLDSLSVAPFVKAGFRVADLGSGAGFPGIPLAIACPDSRVDLIDSRRKKASFLRQVVREARLSNARVIEDRAEALGAAFIGCYDVVVSRAVWRIPKFLRFSRALLRRGGLAIAMKGPKGVEEAADQHEGFSQSRLVEYQLHGGAQRILLVYSRR